MCRENIHLFFMQKDPIFLGEILGVVYLPTRSRARKIRIAKRTAIRIGESDDNKRSREARNEARNEARRERARCNFAAIL